MQPRRRILRRSGFAFLISAGLLAAGCQTQAPAQPSTANSAATRQEIDDATRTRMSAEQFEVERTWTFEDPDIPSDWVPSNAALSLSAGRLEGQALTLTPSEPGVRSTVRVTSSQSTIPGRRVVRAALWVRGQVPGEKVTVALRERGPKGGILTSKSVNLTLDGVNWQPVVATFATPLRAASTDVTVISSGSSPLEIDDVVLRSERLCGAQAPLAPRCGALWGIYTIQGETPSQAVLDAEATAKRTFDITMRFHDFSDHPALGKFPDLHEQILGEDRILLIAWQARVATEKRDIRWSTIARGALDESYIRPAAQRIKEFERPVMIAFDPEFDILGERKGTMSQYVAAYRRIHRIFAEEGVTNVTWVWGTTGYLGAGNDRNIVAGYPGDAYVDWIGFDRYNFFRCNATPWKTFEEAIAGPYAFMVKQGWGDKPFIMPEYGTQYNAANSSRSKRWHAAVPGVLERYPNLKAVIRFDSKGVFQKKETCNFFIDNGTGMRSSFNRAGRAPIVNVGPRL